MKIIFDQINQKNPIDILVNNAGIAHIGTASTTEKSDFERVMQVNVHGAYHTLNACLPHLIRNGGGSIVNIASTIASVAYSKSVCLYDQQRGYTQHDLLCCY